MANPRMQKLQANIKADLKAIDKRFASPAGDGEPLEPKNESPWKLELKPFIDNMASGQLGPNDQAYCPIHLLSRLPVKFLADQLSSDVIEKFYNAGKFWERSWVLYYVWSLDVKDTVILIPEVQLKDFLAELNEAFPNEILDPAQSDAYCRERTLLVDFPEHPRLAPRFLGVSESRGSFDRLCMRIPVQSSRGPDNVHRPPPSTFEETSFDQVVKEVLEALRTDRSQNRRARRDERAKKCHEQMIYAQKFLGLRPTLDSEANSSQLPAAPTKEDEVVPFPCEWDPILICIDFEAWEKDHSYITEAGVAVLDTMDISKIPPGPGAKNWIEKIRSHHFRVAENANMVNSEHVAGYPDKFNFGQSEFLSKDELKEKLLQLIFTVDPEIEPEVNGYGGEEPIYRLFGMIGHGLQADLGFLRRGFGIELRSSRWALGTVDTQSLWTDLHHSQRGSCSLEQLLCDLGIEHEYLHNAGNDATYTMRAFIKMGMMESLSAGAKGGQLVAQIKASKEAAA